METRPYHSIYISETALSAIKSQLSGIRPRPAEARGALLGYATPSNELVITHVAPPATKRMHTTGESTDAENHREEIAVLSERYEGKIDYVGAWCRSARERSEDTHDDPATDSERQSEEHSLQGQEVLLLCSRAAGLFRRKRYRFRALALGKDRVKDRSLQVISDSDQLIRAIHPSNGVNQNTVSPECELAAP